MKNFIRIVLSAALAALAACSPLFYGKLDAPSVAITRDLPPVPGAALGQTAVTTPPITFDLGDITVDESSNDSKVTVNQATLEMVTGTATFAAIDSASVSISDPSGLLPTEVVADYSKARDGAAGTTLTLKGTDGLNLIPYMNGQVVSVVVEVRGVPPTTAWTSQFTLDLHVIAQKNGLPL
jgi:hypothetical protein